MTALKTRPSSAIGSRPHQLPPRARLHAKPTTHPSYGIDPAESGYQDEEYYEEEEEAFEIEEELAKLEEYYADGGDDEDFDAMPEVWSSAVPNRLGDPKETNGESATHAINPDDPRLSCLGLPLSLPYEVETLAEMDQRLDHIACKLVECAKAREFGLGFRMWDSALSIWMSMGYPMKREMKIKLVFFYYELIFIPGLSSAFIEDAGNQFIGLVSDRSLNIYDFRIPWRPLYDALYNELFPHPNKLARHSVNLAPMYLNTAEAAQRFFHPADVDEMLEVIIPKFHPSMDSILATQTFLVHFLPISHCQRWLPLVFRLWHGLNSGLWDDQASDLMGQLAITHVDPARSDPSLLDKIPRGTHNTPEEEACNPNHARIARAHKSRLLDMSGDIEEDADGVNYWADQTKLPKEETVADPSWPGIRKDVGIFTEQEFEFLMSKCLRSLNVPVGGNIASSNAMSVTMADSRASKKILDAKKPIDRVQSLAETIIFCMSEDAPMRTSASAQATPGMSTPLPKDISRLQNGTSITRAGSSDSLAVVGRKVEENRTYLGGSKALDHLSRLLTSCETFFHPSNSGHWSAFLTVFLSHLASNFVERWKAEEEPSCKTPAAWRLTPTIKREFVLSLRPLALTAMFNKDMESMTPAVSTLKKLALIEPDLIMPAVMERAVPSLQGLEETQRTPAVTYALASLAQPLTARRIWRIGGMYIADIFGLLLPGIDLNDPAKTGLSCMAISNIVDFIRLGDIADIEEDDSDIGSRALRRAPRPKVEDDPDDPVQQELEDLSPEEVNSRVRFATAAFRDWVPEFLERVLLLFSNLPEEGGKTGKAGGKTEQLTVQSVLHTCGGVFNALDDKLFDSVLEQVAEYVTTTTRANAVDVVGDLVRNLASSNAQKVFEKLFPIARQRILSELKTGASSLRTTTTSIPRASDASLHWWQSILYGTLIPGRVNLSEPSIRRQYVELVEAMIDSTFSERGWAWTGKIIEKSVSCLTSLYFREMRMLNKDEFNSKDFKNNHTLYWGKLYRAAEIKPDWRVPTQEDISMVFDIIALADDAVTKLNSLLDNRSPGDKVWSNEFCRAMNVVDKVSRGSYNLLAELDWQKQEGQRSETYVVPELLKLPAPYKSGLILTDIQDPRYQHVAKFRARIASMLHQAASAMRDAGESDNSVETVKILVTTIGTFLTAYGIRSKQFGNAQAAYSGMLSSKKLYESQRKHHRSIFMAAASVHHQNRLTTLGYYRIRTESDDLLIKNMLDFCLSPFTRVRRSAQTTLDTIARLYRGTWVLCFPLLFDALQPGSDPDRMKGALYVLRYNHVGISRIGRDWRQLVELTECLLNAHHETKPSVQALVAKATEELLAAIKEPVSFQMSVKCEGIDAAAESLTAALQNKPDNGIVQRLERAITERLAAQDEQWNIFVDRVIQVAAGTVNLNWRYALAASRFLLAVVRRDRPTDMRLAKFFVETVSDKHPRIRDYGIVGTTRLLFQIVMRSLCLGDEARLFLEEPVDTFTTKIKLEDTSEAFTHSYLEAFRQPLPADESTATLQDCLDSGWLAWGREMEVTRLTAWEENAWTVDEGCQPAVKLFGNLVGQREWWQSIADHWAREDTRNYPSATHIDFVLAIVQLYGKPVLDVIAPIMEGYLSEMDSTKVYDRHKMRALCEFLAGLLRGTTEWSGKLRAEFWEWLTPKLPEIFGNIRHDTTKCWDISIEYVLNEQDPRRFKPLIDFCVNTALGADFNSGSAFDLARRVQLIRSIIRCLQWRFNAWADDFVDLYFKSIACPYAEVRGLMASVLNAIDQLKFHPSYPTTAALTEDVLNDTMAEKDIMHIRSGFFEPQLKEIITSLPAWKTERPHGPKAMLSTHDTVALTTLSWLQVELSDVHAVATFPYIIPILPEIFELRELNDNPDLQRTCGRLLAMITSITPSLDLIGPLMDGLISILQNSQSWRTKMHCMPVLSLVYFRNLALISETCKAKCLDVVAACLRDSNQEVREMASATLSGFLRCSQRSMVEVLRVRFIREIKATVLPKRRDAPGQINPDYQAKLVELHGSILGATALVEAFPYTVPKFMPKLLAEELAPRVSEPAPISTTIRSCVASFKRTHEKYQDKFTEDELAAMNYAQAGNSYYA
ncbi:putative membrane protein [Naematelia encephala]|uniref:Putative membrane protein n=1 Tax=Naematelia encephala TaxID=71784 RepID=A0A1Y2BE43_9TREE|nr:putative membrane protein [Naematelia encephala]